ncbi:hypothetical protein [Autumnicola musiva]|uniref:Uncharacterized protein n=1 Tax=Autumnicola musiva TaxID=3075589 RepID=A0ABU3DB83_9FLAO|nr:hypothetical protein [Zunongwangia sp. F117]MDT0678793.1 hypothetical protein [Zunongwangia sp. F117]
MFNLKEILSKKKLDDRAAKTFEILKDRIALINILNDDTFYSRKGKEEEIISINNLRKKLDGGIG